VKTTTDDELNVVSQPEAGQKQLVKGESKTAKLQVKPLTVNFHVGIQDYERAVRKHPEDRVLYVVVLVPSSSRKERMEMKERELEDWRSELAKLVMIRCCKHT